MEELLLDFRIKCFWYLPSLRVLIELNLRSSNGSLDSPGRLGKIGAKMDAEGRTLCIRL